VWYTGVEPFTKRPVTIARNPRDRKLQRALMQFFKPENYFLVRDALAQAGRADLIGGCDGLIPRTRRRRRSRPAAARPTTPTPSPTPRRARSRASAAPVKTGYRPGRKTQQRRPGKKGGGSPPRP
jgi:hypothetical protein